MKEIYYTDIQPLLNKAKVSTLKYICKRYDCLPSGKLRKDDYWVAVNHYLRRVYENKDYFYSCKINEQIFEMLNAKY